MADEKIEHQQDQETIKPEQGDNQELSEKDLENSSGGTYKGWIDIGKV